MAVEIGVRALRENLAGWLERAAAGEEIVVTERGRPKARIVPAAGESILDRLIREGRATAPTRPRRYLPPVKDAEGSPVTDTLLEQRRAKEY